MAKQDCQHLINRLCSLQTDGEIFEFAEKHRDFFHGDCLDKLRNSAHDVMASTTERAEKKFYLVAILTAIARLESKDKNFERSFVLYHEACLLADEYDEPLFKGLLNHKAAQAALFVEKSDEAELHFNNAIAFLVQASVFTGKQPIFHDPNTSEDISWIDMLHSLAVIGDKKGSTKRAIAHLEEAFQLCNQANLPDKSGEMACDLGQLYRKTRQYKQALKYDEKALEFFEKTGKRRQEGMTLAFIGLDYSILGPLNKAIRAYERAVEIAEELKDNLELRNRLGNLASVYAMSGQKETALAHLEKLKATALDHLEKSKNIQINDTQTVEDALCRIEANIGNIYLELGSLSEAQKNYRQAYSLAKRLEDSRLLAHLSGALGIVSWSSAFAKNEHDERQTELDSALKYFEKSLRFYKKGGDDIGRGHAEGNLGLYYFRTVKPELAEPHFRRSLTIFEATNDHRYLSRTCGNLANTLLLQFDKGRKSDTILENAEALYKKAIFHAEAKQDQERLYLWNYNLGNLYRRYYHKLKDACIYYEKSIDHLETIRHGIKGEDFSRSFGEHKIIVYQDMVSTCLDLDDFERALDYAERGKNYTLRRMMAEKNLHPSKNTPDNLRKEYERLCENVRRYESRLVSTHSLSIGANEQENIDLLDATRQIESDYDALEKILLKIRKHDPEFTNILLPGKAKLTLKAVKEHLKKYSRKTVFVIFFVTYERANVFLVGPEKRENKKVIIHHLDSVKLNEFLANRWFKGPDSSKESAGPSEVAGVGNWLYEMIWSQLEKHIRKWKPSSLIIIPHIGLHLLPLHLTRIEEEQFLGQQYQISYAPGFRMLTYCCNDARISRQKNRFLAISNPEHSDPDYDLPSADIEVTSISRFFNKQTILRHERARYDEIKKSAASANFLHFASHGRGATLRKDPMQAGIMLAEGGFLTVENIFSEISLPENFAVILSACETGMVQLDEGDEYVGLPAAFLYAGAPAVICSLWRVEDLATALLIDRWYYYVKMKGIDRGLALKKAQEELSRMTVAKIRKKLFEWKERMEDCRRNTNILLMAWFVTYATHFGSASHIQSRYILTLNECIKDEKKILEKQIETLENELNKYNRKEADGREFQHPYSWGAFFLSGNPE